MAGIKDMNQILKRKKEINFKNSIHMNVGKEGNKVAFVFSCPGQLEESLKRPVDGQIGKI